MGRNEKARDEFFMRKGLSVARIAIRKGQIPFGCVIVKNNRIIASGHNMVWANTDITAHGEMVAIRRACKKTRSILLSGCTLYSTVEPCPMCFTAAHWARIRRIVFGAGILVARQAGFNELEISNRELKKLGKSKVQICGGVLADECRGLFLEWKRRGQAKSY